MTATAPTATTPVPTVRQPSARRGARATRAPLLPGLMIVVTQLPFVATLVISFFDWNALIQGPPLHRPRQ
ncbi:Sugar ABC transporter permease OS=Streptomyces alboniger OX=132473 GN=CP975_08010 PE=3 SV=1 [Streptomyces alboniger]